MRDEFELERRVRALEVWQARADERLEDLETKVERYVPVVDRLHLEAEIGAALAKKASSLFTRRQKLVVAVVAVFAIGLQGVDVAQRWLT